MWLLAPPDTPTSPTTAVAVAPDLSKELDRRDSLVVECTRTRIAGPDRCRVARHIRMLLAAPELALAKRVSQTFLGHCSVSLARSLIFMALVRTGPFDTLPRILIWERCSDQGVAEHGRVVQGPAF